MTTPKVTVGGPELRFRSPVALFPMRSQPPGPLLDAAPSFDDTLVIEVLRCDLATLPSPHVGTHKVPGAEGPHIGR